MQQESHTGQNVAFSSPGPCPPVSGIVLISFSQLLWQERSCSHTWVVTGELPAPPVSRTRQLSRDTPESPPCPGTWGWAPQHPLQSISLQGKCQMCCSQLRTALSQWLMTQHETEVQNSLGKESTNPHRYKPTQATGKGQCRSNQKPLTPAKLWFGYKWNCFNIATTKTMPRAAWPQRCSVSRRLLYCSGWGYGSGSKSPRA